MTPDREKCPRCGNMDFAVARDIVATRKCKCGESWEPKIISQELLAIIDRLRDENNTLRAEIDRLRTEKNTLRLRLESAAIAYPYTPEGREHIAIQLQGSQIDELSQQVDRLRALNDSLSTDLGIAVEALDDIARLNLPFPPATPYLSDYNEDVARKALKTIGGKK